MNLSNCHFYVLVRSQRRCFKLPFNTIKGAQRCYYRYSCCGFSCEIHDRFLGKIIHG